MLKIAILLRFMVCKTQLKRELSIITGMRVELSLKPQQSAR